MGLMGSFQPSPSLRAPGAHIGLGLGPHQVEQALPVLRRKGVDIDHAGDAARHPVGRPGRHHAAIGMAEQGNVLQILDLDHRGDVLDMGRQVDSGVRQMGALAQPGVGRRKKLMPVGPNKRR